MCYTASTSINTFVIGLLSSLLLYLKSSNDISLSSQISSEYKIVALFFMFVSFMQLFDYIFWTNYRNQTNKTFTKIATIVNHLQPIVLAILIYTFSKNSSERLSSFSKYLTYFYSIIILLYTINIWNSLEYTEVTEKSSPSLFWKWNAGENAGFVYSVFLITLIILFYSNLPNIGIFVSIITAMSFFLSFFKYQIQISTGRFWCYFAAFAPLIFLLL